MARAPTLFSRVSTGWSDSAQSLADVDAGDTGEDFSCINGAATGTWAVTGALTQTGAATFSSTVTAAGQITATSGIAVGGGDAVTVISTTTASVDIGNLTAGNKSVDTVALSGATNGDTLIVSPDSLYSGDWEWVELRAVSGDTTGEVNLLSSNVSTEAIDPGAMTFRITRIGFGSFI